MDAACPPLDRCRDPPRAPRWNHDNFWLRRRGLATFARATAAVEALRGLDFDIERGETFALLGPNGAGKSTTIEILEGYRDRTAGTVSVLGVDPQRGGLDWKARLGIVLQSSGEQGDATVREQLTHFAGFYPNPRDVDEVIAAVGLEDKASSLIRKLSGGQRRRVDVALGIIGRPELLFLDEPTTGFDPEARRQFWTLIDAAQDGGHDHPAHHPLPRRGRAARATAPASSPTADWSRSARSTRSAAPTARIPIVRWTRDGVAHEERTERPGELVARLAADGEPDRLEVIRPSLEDIYLELVGDAEPRGAARHPPERPVMTTTRTAIVTPGRIVRIGVSRIRYEIIGYFRQGDAVFFTFLFPVVMLTIFSVAFSEQQLRQGCRGPRRQRRRRTTCRACSPRACCSADCRTSRSTSRARRATARSSGWPAPRSRSISYFIGKIGRALVTGILQAALLILLARVAFGVALPTEPGTWLTFAWVFLLGVATCAILGIGLERPAPLGQERDRGHHPDRAGAAVHLGRLPGLHEPADLAAERRERLPAQVAGAGHALGVPAVDLRGRRGRRQLEPAGRRDRARHLARRRADRSPGSPSAGSARTARCRSAR